MVSLSNITGHKPDNLKYLPHDGFVLSTCKVGVEVELEGYTTDRRMRFLSGAVHGSQWRITNDGSLRDGGIELVLRQPLFGKDLHENLLVLDKVREVSKPRLTYRTSVHVHLDVRDLSLEQFVRLVCLYMVFEKALVKYHGGVREDNIFCLPFYKATKNVEYLGQVINLLNTYDDLDKRAEQTAKVSDLLSVFTKYHALNLSSLFKFGSLEFRHMPGNCNSEDIEEWINIIMCLKKEAKNNDRLPLNNIPSTLSTLGMSDYAESVFGNLFEKLNYPTFEAEMLEGVRLAQDYVYYGNLLVSNVELDKPGESTKLFNKFLEKQRFAGKRENPLRQAQVQINPQEWAIAEAGQ